MTVCSGTTLSGVSGCLFVFVRKKSVELVFCYTEKLLCGWQSVQEREIRFLKRHLFGFALSVWLLPHFAMQLG
jgi:hypothetical protein